MSCIPQLVQGNFQADHKGLIESGQILCDFPELVIAGIGLFTYFLVLFKQVVGLKEEAL